MTWRKPYLAGLFLVFSVLSLAAAADDIEPVEREHFVYYFDSPRHIDYADSVLEEVRLELIQLLHDTLSYKPAVYLLDDLNYFREVIHGNFPDWGAAAAVPMARLMALKSPDRYNLNKPLHELLKHEYAHLAVAHRVGIRSIPRWFDEGMAMLVSSEWGWSDNLAMSKAAIFGEFIPLREIENLNRFSDGKAQVAYSQSYLAVRYIQREYGDRGLLIFLDEIARGALISEALTTSTGATYREFEKEFNGYLSQRYNVASLFLDTMWFWLALAMIVVIGAFLRYRKRRQYYKKWEEAEKYQSTDFDYGDPDHPERIDDEDEPWRS
jgi:hypothetical protein